MLAIEQARWHLEHLGLTQAAEIPDGRLDVVAKKQVPYADFLADLPCFEVAARRQRNPQDHGGRHARITRHRVITTDAEIDAAIAEARARENDRPRAVKAYYDASDDKGVIRLASGVDVAIPRTHLRGLENATRTQTAEIQLEGAGSGLHWPSLDVDHYIPGLLAGVFGARRWMSELGRKGGAVRRAAKAAAARANGRKGGRPRRHVLTVAASSLVARGKRRRAGTLAGSYSSGGVGSAQG